MSVRPTNLRLIEREPYKDVPKKHFLDLCKLKGFTRFIDTFSCPHHPNNFIKYVSSNACILCIKEMSAAAAKKRKMHYGH